MRRSITYVAAHILFVLLACVYLWETSSIIRTGLS